MTESRGLPPIPPAQIWLGDRANEAGDFEAAVKYYQRGIELYDIQGADTDRRRAFIERWLSAVETAKLANVYEKLNQTPQAEEAYRRAVTSARQLFREYHANQIVQDAFRDRVNQLTDFLDRQGRADDAIAQLDQLLLEFPTSEGLHLAKASRHQKLKQFDVALAACNKAVDLAPSNSEAYYCRGNVLSRNWDETNRRTRTTRRRCVLTWIRNPGPRVPLQVANAGDGQRRVPARILLWQRVWRCRPKSDCWTI